MKSFLCQIYLMIRVLGSYITYDSAQFTMIAFGDGQSCLNQAGQNVLSKTVIFNGIFAHIPQIMIFIKEQDMKYGTTEYTFNILDVNFQNCTFRVQCLALNLNTLIFTWVAIDDKRISVLDNFNFNATGISSYTFTLSHTNQYAKDGFVIMTDVGFKGAITYLLQVTSVTSNQVIVQFTKGNSNLLSVGFQVVIGTLESFVTLPLIQFSNFKDGVLSQSTITKLSGYKLFLAFMGWNLPSWSDAMRFSSFFTETTTQITSTVNTWGSNVYSTFTYQQIWFNLQNSRVLVPFLCKGWRVSKKKDYTAVNTQLYIQEKNQNYTIGYYNSIILDQTFNSLNIITSFKCQSVQKVTGSVLLCIDCQTQTKDISIYCYGGMNLLEHHFKFVQNDQVYQKLTINITASSITVIQSVVGTQGTIISLRLDSIK